METQNNEENGQSKRTSVEQLEYFVELARKRPEMLANKNDPTNPQRIKNLWAQLAEGPNAMSGPTRPATKWKETLTHWKHQLKSRARKMKVSSLTTGGGPPTNITLKKYEERALQVFGTITVDGLPDLPTLGLGIDNTNVSANPLQEIVIDCDEDTKSEYLDSEFLEEFSIRIISQPSQPALKELSPNSPAPEMLHTPAPAFKTSAMSDTLAPLFKKKGKAVVQHKHLWKKMLDMMKKRDERDLVLQKENLGVQKSMAEALISLGNSIQYLADSITQHNKTGDSSSDNDN